MTDQTKYPSAKEVGIILSHALLVDARIIFRSITSSEYSNLTDEEGKFIAIESLATPNWVYQFATIVEDRKAGHLRVYCIQLNSEEEKNILARDIVAIEDATEPETQIGSYKGHFILLQEPTAENPSPTFTSAEDHSEEKGVYKECYGKRFSADL